MRSLIGLSVLAAAALGACTQSLTGHMSGTGGSPMGIGNTGGSFAGTGGAGVDLASVCSDLASQYQSAIVVAQTCQAGQSGQCQTLIDATLSICGACPTYVNDPSKPLAIQQAWLAAGCTKLPPPPCVQVLCAKPVNAVCGVVLDTNRGTCVPGPSGTGGSSPDAGPSCDDLVQAYATALSAARSCTYGVDGQCGHSVPQSLSICTAGCFAYVNDPTPLNTIRQAWDAANCGKAQVACPAVACAPTTAGACSPADGGGATCTPVENAP
jgi:hypothetical protein